MANNSTLYTMLDEIHSSLSPLTPKHSTPAVKDTSVAPAVKDTSVAPVRYRSEYDSFFDDMGMDRPKERSERLDINPVGSYPQQTKARMVLARKRTPMKTGRFDGTGSFESFITQFEV